METRKQIAVVGSFLANPQSVEYTLAEELGYRLAAAGFDVICGGHGGIAHPLVSGVVRGGGAVRGISLTESKFPRRSASAIPRLTEVFPVDSIAGRLESLASADGYVVFTGGIGTLTEFAFIWHSLQVEADFARPVIFLSRTWKHVLEAIRKGLMVKSKYFRHIHLCEGVGEAVAVLSRDFSMKYDEPGKIFFRQGVLFEAEGTIVESREEEFVRLCEDLGYFFRPADVIGAFDKARRSERSARVKADAEEAAPDYYVQVLERLGMDAGTATEVAEDVCGKLQQIPELYDDAVDLLRHLKENGFLTGVLSSRRPLRLKRILSAHHLSGWFDLVGPECTGQRPQAGGLRRENAVCVGTHLPEKNPDRGATGVDAILLDRYLVHMAEEKAFKIRSLHELKHAIRHVRNRA